MSGKYGGSTYVLRRNSSKRAEVPCRQYIMSADGAVPIADDTIADTVFVTKGSACAMTLAAPTAGSPESGGHDGKRIRFVSQTAQAHTLTITAGFNGGGTASDVGTFGGAISDCIELEAYNGTWWVIDNTNVTLA